jgi:hypothetical protein
MNRMPDDETASSPRPSPPLEEEREFSASLPLSMVTMCVFKILKLSMYREVTLRQPEPEWPTLGLNVNRLTIDRELASSPRPSPPLEEERECAPLALPI